MKYNRQAAPPYSEAQAIAWLAWLARGMQQHGQTIFQIEQLQPSWLSTRMQHWVYILTSRLIWGVLVGLSGPLFCLFFLILLYGWAVLMLCVLSGGQNCGQMGLEIASLINILYQLLKVGLVSGLFAGLMGGLMGVFSFTRNHSRAASNDYVTRRQAVRNSVLFGLIMALIGGLVVMRFLASMSGDPRVAYLGGLIFVITFTPITALLWMHRGFGRDPENEIHTVETIRFSWMAGCRGILLGLAVCLVAGMVFGLLVPSILQQARTLQLLLGLGLIFGLFGGLLGGLLGGLIGGFRPGIRELKTTPNQGIRLSLRTGSAMGGISGLVLGLMMGWMYGWVNGLMYGALGGLCIALWFGGLDVIQHYLVRTLLWRASAMPWNYARFLDHAAEELNFLQKVGGGYIFVHRYLLEYFATMELPGQPAASDRHNISQPIAHAVDSV